MKKKILRAAALAAAVLCGCSSVEDVSPDTAYEYDDITDAITETSAPAAVSLPEAVTAAQAEESTPALSSETEDTGAAAGELPPPEITSAESSETAAPETTAFTGNEAPLTETGEISTTGAAVFVPGTIPPEYPDETAPAETLVTSSSKPSVTVLTVPHSAESEPSESTRAPAPAYGYEAYYPENSYYTLNFDRQKAVWVSYLEFDRIMRNADENSFASSLCDCFDNIAALGCNTVYFQVRVYGDAYYRSSLFPKGDRLTGDYDPLEIAVKAAHDRGLSIHAWINPMRLMTDSQIRSVPSVYKVGQWYADSSKNGRYIVSSNGRWYLNPAYAETVALICEGISEIVTGYDVDGVQIDDYFYPTTDASFDKDAYIASGTSLSLSDWRRENVTKMVKQMYSAVHSANPTAVFGISPQGNTDNNYNDLYADVYTWCSTEGCCDYICPQIYYGFENSALPYARTVDEWSRLVTRKDIALVIGLAAYKSGTEDKYAGDGRNEWINSTDILSRQRELTDIYGAGYAFFRYDSLFLPDPSAALSVSAELENLKKQDLENKIDFTP